MIKSMTGYGKSVLNTESKKYQIEIKSVNHRYLDITVKIPRVLNYLEEYIKKEISQKIKRGKIDVYINFNDESQDGKSIVLNKQLAKMYIEQLKQLAEEENISQNIEVTEITKIPDVLKVETDEENEQVKEDMIAVTKDVIEKILEMKITEGEKIAQDLLNRTEKIKQKIIEISEKSTGLIDEYVVKLEKRIKEILKTEDVDKARLAQEVVIYADKSSIEEEITRLKSHIYQLSNIINAEGEEPKGKKLDFLIQEMNRETNTIGSKSNSLEITNAVIDIKTELEDIREQVQNIE